MNSKDQIHEIGFLSLLILAMLINITTQTIHETGHLMVFQLMGHDPVWGFTKLVQIWDTSPINPDEWVKVTGPDSERGWLKLSSPIASKAEDVISTAAGPLAGLLSAVLGLVITRRSKGRTFKQTGLALAMSASLVAVLYYLRSPLRTGGDEYNIAMQLGIARSTIDIPLLIAFSSCLILSLRELPSWRVRLKWLGTVLIGSMTTGLLLFNADSLVISQVNAGNPWFQPVFGYSLPVFLTNGLALIGIWIWARRQAT